MYTPDLEIGRQTSPSHSALIGVSERKGDRVFMQVTIWGERNALGNLALVWSLLPVPWLIFLLAIVDGAGSYWAWVICTAGAGAILNEFFLKPYFKESRPIACPNKDSFGMPSGHSLFSGQVLIMTFYGITEGRIGRSSLGGPGLIPGKVLLLLTLIFLLPVPWARWYNQDHSGKQVAAGFALGALIAFLLSAIFN